METPTLSAQPTKHQVKTEATVRGLLDAAETVFVRDGYERAQIGAIATEAGRTKGAVYAHFRSKEEIFLAVLERKAKSLCDAFLQSAAEATPQQRFETLKEVYLCTSEYENWQILALEFKLVALRNKAAFPRIRECYQLLNENVDRSLSLLDDGATDAQKQRMLVAKAVLRSIPSAVLLEKQFCAGLNSPGARPVLGALFDLLLGHPDLACQRKDNSPKLYM